MKIRESFLNYWHFCPFIPDVGFVHIDFPIDWDLSYDRFMLHELTTDVLHSDGSMGASQHVVHLIEK